MHCLKQFIYFFNTYNTMMLFSLSHFENGGDWGTEQLSNLPKVTYLVNGQAGIQSVTWLDHANTSDSWHSCFTGEGLSSDWHLWENFQEEMITECWNMNTCFSDKGGRGLQGKSGLPGRGRVKTWRYERAGLFRGSPVAQGHWSEG